MSTDTPQQDPHKALRACVACQGRGMRHYPQRDGSAFVTVCGLCRGTGKTPNVHTIDRIVKLYHDDMSKRYQGIARVGPVPFTVPSSAALAAPLPPLARLLPAEWIFSLTLGDNAPEQLILHPSGLWTCLDERTLLDMSEDDARRMVADLQRAVDAGRTGLFSGPVPGDFPPLRPVRDGRTL